MCGTGRGSRIGSGAAAQIVDELERASESPSLDLRTQFSEALSASVLQPGGFLYEAIIKKGGNAWLKNAENVKPRSLKISQLTATQRGASFDVIRSKLRVPDSALPLVLRKGGKYYLTDGHHRVVSWRLQRRQRALFRILDLD